MKNYYTSKELKNIFKIKDVGQNVFIKKNCIITNPKNLIIGNNVRIDDFCVFAGKSKIKIGSFVHIGAFSFFNASDQVILNDFVSFSSNISLYTGSENINGNFFANPTIPVKYREPMKAKVIIKKLAWIGPKCTILPGCVIGEGAAVLGNTLINKSLPSWNIYFGSPIKKLKKRNKINKSYLNKLLNEKG